MQVTEYGRIHTDGSRSGGQPTQSDAVKLADELQETGDHPYLEHLPLGKLLRDCAAVLRQPPQSDALRAALERIEAQAAEIERLLELLNAWTELASEHLDTELAGLTFAALRGAGHG